MHATQVRSGRGWKLLARFAFILALAVGLTFTVAKPAHAWIVGAPGIYNMGGVGIGVVHTRRTPPYDAVLPQGYSTSGLWGWAYATGFYVGPGWCTNYYRAGWSSYVYAWTVKGPGYGWKIPQEDGAVYSYRC